MADDSDHPNTSRVGNVIWLPEKKKAEFIPHYMEIAFGCEDQVFVDGILPEVGDTIEIVCYHSTNHLQFHVLKLMYRTIKKQPKGDAA